MSKRAFRKVVRNIKCRCGETWTAEIVLHKSEPDDMFDEQMCKSCEEEYRSEKC